MLETIYQSEVMRKLVTQAQIAASSSAPAFITGEHGVGKEHIARMLHDSGNRASKPFVEVNCAALPRELIEAELFGSKKGSYTGSVADRRGLFREAGTGTIFLDEIAEMPIEVQSKLLRVLQDKVVRPVGDSQSYPVECRIIAATNRKVDDAISQNKLRVDLYYRLAVITLHLPPLRQRRDDIPVLAKHFLQKCSQEEQKEVSVATTVFDYLSGLPWDGNVRQLQNAIHRAVIFSKGSITPNDFVDELPAGPSIALATAPASFDLDTLIKDTCVAALKKHNGNKQSAAKEMGVGRQTLYNYLKRYGIASDGGESVEAAECAPVQ